MSRDYYVFSSGLLKRAENNICFIDSNDNKRTIPVEDVERIHLFGELDLNTKFLNFLSQYGVILNFYNYYGYFTGCYYPRKKNVSGLLVVKQSLHYLDYSKRLFMAKSFIDSAIHHILRILRRHIDESEIINKAIESIEEEKENMYNAKSIEEVMGCEGRARKNYYDCFNVLLKNNFNFEKREKRPPRDPLNALISFGNSLMYSTVLGQIYETQLDPTISFLHEPSTKRFSLSLDIAEIFKPLIVDSIIFAMINNRMLNNKDFEFDNDICFLGEGGKKKFIREFDKKLSTTIKHRALNRKVSYKNLIKLECYKMIKYFLEDEPYKPLKAWW